MVRLGRILAVAALGSTLLTTPAGSLTAPGSPVWVARYDGPGHFLDEADAVAVSPDGATVYVTGLSDRKSFLFSADYATIAYDAKTGAELWVDRYNGPGGGWDHARAIAVSPDGNTVYVTGGSRGIGTGQDYGTIAYEAATGARLWVARHDGATHRLDSALSIAVSPNGGTLYVGGWSQTGVTERGNRRLDFATVAYTAESGRQLWLATYSGPSGSDDYAFSVAVGPDGGRVYVTGWDRGGHGFTDDASTVAYDAATGAQLWVARYDGAIHRSDAAYSLALSPDGQTVFIAGESYSRRGVDHALAVAFNAATGAQLWAVNSRLFAGTEYSNATSVEVAPDSSRVYITGATSTARATGCLYPNDYLTAAFDAATGTRLWASRYDGSAHCYDYAQSIGVSPDGRAVYVTGTSKGEGQDYATVAYDAISGEQIQVARYDGPAGWDAANALAVGPDGSLYVTGESASRHYRDYGTIRYVLE